MTLRLVFMGTPEFAVPTLEALLAAGHEICAVYTQPPRPAGRGMAERLSPVHQSALRHNLPVFTPLSLKAADEHERMRAFNADAAVVVAYGLLLPRAVLDAPRLGCFNLHASKLPRWRGAAPIQRAIMAGDAETAVMVMRMEAGLDTGPICASRLISISCDETAGDLHDRLAAAGAPLMVDAMAGLVAGTLQATPQPEAGVVYAAKIDKAEAQIDFSRPAAEVHNHIRGLSPFPGAWFEAALGSAPPERIKALRSRVLSAAETTAGPETEPGRVLDDHLTIACGQGAVQLLSVQRAGKRPMPANEFLRGFALCAGSRVKHSS